MRTTGGFEILIFCISSMKMWQSIFDELDSNLEPVCTEPECLHSNIGVEDNVELCFDCGLIFCRKFCANQFSNTSVMRNKSSMCPIFSEMSLLLDSEVKNLTVIIYKQVTVSRIYRSTFRRSIVAACLHRASRVLGKPVLFNDLLKMFEISVHEANKGIAFVAANLPKGDYFVSFFSASLEIESILKIVGAPEIARNVESIFNMVSQQLSASSQLKSVICGCIWFHFKTFSKSKISLKHFAEKCEMASSTIQKKMTEVKKFALRKILKRIFSWCLTVFGTVDPVSDGGSIKILNSRDPDAIRIIDTEDGFEYPLDDVDNVQDWNILLGKNWFFLDVSFCIGAVVTTTKTDVGLSFDKCIEPINSLGQARVEQELIQLFET